MQEQQFDIGMYFTIKYYADKHSKTITRRAKFTEECEFGTHKVHGYPYFRYFDVDADTGNKYRTAVNYEVLA